MGATSEDNWTQKKDPRNAPQSGGSLILFFVYDSPRL
jgi:hypothetical protein